MADETLTALLAEEPKKVTMAKAMCLGVRAGPNYEAWQQNAEGQMLKRFNGLGLDQRRYKGTRLSKMTSVDANTDDADA
ncbi:MAG: hypothetical protein OIF58_05815 [Cohaesibacter sp.]|nr:hypothetical protein [Cohaesibacter sp.]